MKSRALLILLCLGWLSMSLADAQSQAPPDSPRAGDEAPERPGTRDDASEGPAAGGDDDGDENVDEEVEADEEEDDDEADGHQPDSAGPPAGAAVEVRDRWLSEHIHALIAKRQALAGVRLGIHVQDPRTGRVVFQHRSEERYSVASCAKLITASAALALLGPDFQPRTAVLAEEVDERGVIAGDLYLRGQGDPGLGLGDLHRLADELALTGVTAVNGRLVIDDTYFDDQVLPPHFDEQPDEEASFRAPVGALSPAFNAFTVVVRPALAGRGPALVSIDPPGDYATIAENALITQPSGRNRLRLSSEVERGRVTLALAGQIRSSFGVRRFRRRVPDPLVFAGTLFSKALAERGIAVRRRGIARGRTPDAATPLAWVHGAPVALLVRGLGKHSNNFMAEMLLKIIGAEARGEIGPATWQDGLSAVRGFLRDRVGLAPDSYRYGNGSGLFDATAVSPAQLVAVLQAAYRDASYGLDLIASLAIAGVDGTLRRRMHDTPAQGLVRAKTGTLATVTALAGYAALDNQRTLAFAVAVNDLPDSGRAGRRAKRQARSLQDRIASALIRYLESQRGAPL